MSTCASISFAMSSSSGSGFFSVTGSVSVIVCVFLLNLHSDSSSSSKNGNCIWATEDTHEEEGAEDECPTQIKRGCEKEIVGCAFPSPVQANLRD